MGSKRIRSRTQINICTTKFIAALFTVAGMWKQPKYLPIDESISKMQCIHTMEYYLAMKREEILNLKDIRLREINIRLTEINRSQRTSIE